MKKFFFHAGLSVMLCWNVTFCQTGDRLSLHDAITVALNNNPLALASLRQIDAEQGRFWRGVSPPSPTISVNYQYIPASSSIRHFGERTFEISQSFDFPTTILFKGMQLSSRVSIAEEEQASTSIEIALHVKVAYYDVLAKQKKIELALENSAIADDFARKAEIRSTVGEGTNLERLTASVQRTQAHNSVETARNDLRVSLGELYHALGRAYDDLKSALVLTDSLTYQPIVHTLEQVTEMAFAVNPQRKAASRKVSAASLGRTLAWSSILPTMNASYYRQTVDGSSDFYGVSFGISVPLWFLFDQRGQIEEASANAGIAEAGLVSVNNALHVYVRNAYLETKNNERQIMLHRTDILPQAEEMYRIAFASYEAGDISYIEYLQARQLLVSTRNEYVDELALYCKSVAKLEYAIGTAGIQ